MRVVRTRFSLFLLAGSILAIPMASAQTTITCVAVEGTRQVSSPTACDPTREAVVQRSSSHSPAPAARESSDQYNIILVTASGSAEASGQALQNAINSITESSADNPYLIVLGPGRFALPSAVTNIPQWVSLQGFSMDSTSISSNGSMNFIVESGSPTNSFFVADLGLFAAQVTIPMAGVSDIVLDRVDSSAALTISSPYPTGSVRITDSLLTGALTFGNKYAEPGLRYHVIRTEVDSLTLSGTFPSGTVLCKATYRANFVDYSNTCR